MTIIKLKSNFKVMKETEGSVNDGERAMERTESEALSEELDEKWRKWITSGSSDSSPSCEG